MGDGQGYAQLAVLNARAQTLGDPGGVDLSFDDGLLVTGEVGGGKAVRVSLGGWTYTRARDALSALAPDGTTLRERPAGLYAMAEAHLADGGARAITAFVRGGVARGHTQAFVNSAQAGLFVAPAILGRDNTAFSVGVNTATTSADARQAQRDAGDPAVRQEHVLELTYLDQLLPHLTLQPDLQIIRQIRDDAAANTAVQTTLRVQISF